MAQRRSIPLTILAFGLLASFVTVGLLTFTKPAQAALPPAGSDQVGVTGDVTVVSRLGTEMISVQGNVMIAHGDPHVDAGRDVIDTQITAMALTGQSVTGPVTISQSVALASHGEVRSVNPSPSDFPASSFFDVFVDIVAPSSGSRTPPPFTVHNEVPIHLVPTAGGHQTTINAWPASGVEWRADPLTPGPLHCVDEGGIPLLPAQPAEICVTKVSLVMGPPITPTPTLTPCPPIVCTPTPTPSAPAATATHTPRPTLTPTRTATPFGPEDPTFSVAPGGPSGFHPAALLRITSGGTPPPIDVAGNDNFSNAWQITALPFAGVESTTNFTTETGEQLNPGGCITVTPFTKGATAWFRFTAPATGTMNIDTNGSAVDTVLAVYTGSTLAGLNPRACDDDGGEGLQSLIESLSVTTGTNYYIQVGGFDADDGPMHLNLTSPSGAGAGSSVSVAITCSALGLTPDGCDNGADGDQDNIDALSFGNDTLPNTNPIAFSVAPGSHGVASSAVAAQAACSPPEPQADEFTSGRNGTNTLVLDGDGQGSGCPGGFGLGLIERPNSDNLDALDGHSPDFVDPNRDGVLDEAVYFSLAPGSPSLAATGESPADILWTIGFSPGVYASAAMLGLQPADDIDGLCLVDRGKIARYEPDVDRILFSLKAGSPTLTMLGASAADVLAPGPSIRYHASELGLQASDDLDAMKCFQTSGPSTVKVPVGDVYFCDPAFSNGTVCDTKVNVGDTVAWNWIGTAPHNVEECGPTCPPSPGHTPAFESAVMNGVDGGHFEFTFNTPGSYLYYCEVHGTTQMGRIIVNGPGGTPTPTQTSPVATPTRTPTPGAPPARPGDGNCSGRVDSIDAAVVLQLSAGLLHSLPCPQNGDVNGDGRTNSLDAQLILQFVARLIPHLPP